MPDGCMYARNAPRINSHHDINLISCIAIFINMREAGIEPTTFLVITQDVLPLNYSRKWCAR